MAENALDLLNRAPENALDLLGGGGPQGKPFTPSQYTGAPDEPVGHPLSPLEMAVIAGVTGPAAGGIAGLAPGTAAAAEGAPLLARAAPWLLRSAISGGAANTAFGGVSDVLEGQNPLPNIPGNFGLGAVLGPPAEALSAGLGAVKSAIARRIMGHLVATPASNPAPVAAEVQAAAQEAMPRLAGMQTYAQEVGGVGGLAPQPNVLGEAIPGPQTPPPPVAPTPEAPSIQVPPTKKPLQIQRFPTIGTATPDQELKTAARLASKADAVEVARRAETAKALGLKTRVQVQGYFADAVNPERAPQVMLQQTAINRGTFQRAIDREPSRIQDALDDAALKWHRHVTSGESFFRTLGQPGAALADMSRLSRANTLQRIGLEGDQIGQLAKRYTEQEAYQVKDVLEGGVSNNPKINHAAEQLRQMFAGYEADLTALNVKVQSASTGSVSNFTGRENYFPRIYTEESIRKVANPIDRATIRRQFRNLPPTIRAGNAQFAREMELPGYEQNAFKAAAMYVDRTAPRVEQARVFGGSDEKAIELLNQIRTERSRAASDQANSVYKAMVYPQGEGFSPAAHMIADLAAPWFLTLSGVVQPVQVFTNTVAREGLVNTIKGVARWATSAEDRQLVRRSGALIKGAAEDISGLGPVSKTWSKIIGLQGADRINRYASALAARFRAQDLAEAFRAGKLTPANIRDAKRLGLDVEEMSRNGWNLTPQQERNAMTNGAVSTQFASDILSSPLASKRGWGPLLYLYKSYAFNQARLLKDLTIEAKLGRWQPLAKYMATLGTAGALWGEGQRLLRGQPPPDSPFWRWTEDMASVGGMGAYGDAVNAVGQSPERIYSYIVGPVASEAVAGVAETGKAIQGEPEGLYKHVLRRTVKRIPVVGQQLYEQMAP